MFLFNWALFANLRAWVALLRRENLDRLILIVVLLILLGALALMVFEPDLSAAAALWLVFATVTTVGYGDVSAQTLGGRIVSIVIMIFGIGILGLFTAAIASVFVERKMKEDKGMSSFDFEGHIIICQWNHHASEIIQQLRMEARTSTTPIVLLAELAGKPLDDPNLYFINGDVNEKTLLRANLPKASTALILGDDSLEAGARDAKVVLTALTVETLSPEAYTIVELVNESNVKHCENANADEIIVGSEFSSRLIARAAVDHGISKVLSELLSSKVGSDLSMMPVPEEMVGRSFIDLFVQLKSTVNCTVLAVQRGLNGQVISNPDKDTKLEAQDYLIVIQSSEGAQHVS